MRMKFFVLLAFTTLLLLPGVCFAEVLFTFDGQYDFQKSQINVNLQFPELPSEPKDTIKQNSLTLKGGKEAEDTYRISLNVDHLQTPLFDLSSEVESLFTIPRKNNINEYIRGKIWSQYSLVDFKPIREMSGDFRVENNRVYLNRLVISDVMFDGFIELQAPYKVDLRLKLSDMMMADFLRIWTNQKGIASGGLVTGEIKATGSLKEGLYLRGDLEGHQGYVKKLEFDTLHLKVEGVYPHMEISPSTVTRIDGLSYTFAGNIDLSDTTNFARQIAALHIAPVISESAMQREWTIRRLHLDETTTTEFKYLLRKDNGLGLAPEGTDMLGVERSVEF